MFEIQPSKVASAKNDFLSGLTVALALVPEAVAFAFVAGVEPLVGLYAAFMVGLITACIGGRPWCGVFVCHRGVDGSPANHRWCSETRKIYSHGAASGHVGFC